MARPNQRLERLSLLAPFLQEPARAFLDQAERDLHQLLFVVFTYRSPQQQHHLYSQGREFRRDEGVWVVTNPKLVVTNALPGSTPHNVELPTGEPAAVAIDVVPYAPNGSLAWETPMAIWEKLWTLGWKCGLDPLGDTVGAYLKGDLGHFEEPGWKLKLSGLSLVRPTGTEATTV